MSGTFRAGLLIAAAFLTLGATPALAQAGGNSGQSKPADNRPPPPPPQERPTLNRRPPEERPAPPPPPPPAPAPAPPKADEAMLPVQLDRIYLG